MKTVVLQEPGRLRLADAQEPGPPGPGEALVRVRRVGICGSDLHAFRGRQSFFSYPRILGHELGVEIVALGPGTQGSGLSAGDRCCVEPYLNCGECSACRRGKPNCCLNLKVLGVHIDGGMQELLTVPAAKLHRSQALPFDQLALVETLCIGAHAVRRAHVRAEDTVLVIGSGPIGMSAIQFVQAARADPIVMEIVDNRLEFCRRQLGVERLVDGRREPERQIRAHMRGNLPSVVLDATGSTRSMTQAFGYVAHGGRLVFVGHVRDDITFHDPDFHQRELTLLASRNATAEDFAHVLGLVEAGKVNLAPWITHRASPEEIVSELPRWLEPESGVIKAMLEF
jgi:2-desacetyl-2-hydroxyethyl bacteriochlorophyllide A dehydrogenase